MRKLRIILIIVILYGAMIPANLIIRDIFIDKAQAAEVVPPEPPGTLSHTRVLVLHFTQLTTPTPMPTPSPLPADPTPVWTPESIPLPTSLYTPMPDIFVMADGEVAPGYIVRLHRPQLLNREEVKAFMLWDNTSDKVYIDGQFTCGDFSRSVIAHATKWNEEVHILAVHFITDSGYSAWHSLVRFPTIEDGDVYVDCTQGDWFVNMQYGPGCYYTVSMADPGRYGFYNCTLVEAYEDFRGY